MNLYSLEAEVHKKLDNGSYRVKVHLLHPDIGMYINGNIVSPPNNEYANWSVRTPRVYRSKAGIIEFDGKSPLWREYKQACIDVVQEYIRHERLDNTTEDIDLHLDKNDEEFKKHMLDELNNIPF